MTDDTKASSVNDPCPQSPIPPAPGRCCHSGCGESCVEEVYAEELRAYRATLHAWKARQADSQ